MKTSAEVPKDSVLCVAADMQKICVQAPVRIGEVLMENIADTGVDIIATRTIERKSGDN